MRKPSGPPGKTRDRSHEAAALLAAARAVLENRAFTDAARAILVACKAILGADAGLVAVSPPSGTSIEVALLDPGSLNLDSAGGLPAPLRRLSARASKVGRTVFANDLSKSTVTPPPSGRRSVPENALLAPIIIDGDVAGLVGLINKPGGFSPADSRLAEVFAEMAAVAMLNSRTINGFEKNRSALEREVREGVTHLHQAEEQFKTLVENLPDVVARFDPDLRHLYISPAVQRMTGRRPQDFVGRTNRELGMPSELVEQWDAALRKVFTTGRPERLEFAFPAAGGTRHFDSRLVPEPGPAGSIPSVLSVARDVTPRWLALEAERRARTVADELREATVALNRSLDRETVLATLLDRLRRLVPFDRARAMLLEEASRVSVRAIFDGSRVVPLRADERPEFEASDHPIVHDILTNGAVVLIPDIRAHPGWSLPTETPAEVSWMGVPLFARSDVTGLLSLSKREAGYFNEKHKELAEAMSSQASVAVENAVLFEQMQASTVRMQQLSRRLVEAQESERRNIARELHDEAGQALASLRIGLRLLEREIDEGGRQVFARAMSGEAQWTVVERCPIIENTAAETKVVGQGWVVCTPIRSPHKLIGMLYNDAGLTNSAVDPQKQEAAAVLCVVLGQRLTALRGSGKITYGPAARHPAVAAAVRMLTDDPSLRGGDIAEKIGVSLSRFARVFKSDMGMSLVDFRNQLRLERFLSLVDAGRTNLLEAAYAAGFGSYSQFHRVFRALRGASPRDYFSGGH